MDQKESFTHLDQDGKAKMVDVSSKAKTCRRAHARGKILLGPAIVSAIEEERVKKGDIFSVSKTAGIMAVKKTWDLIPLCHQVQVSGIEISFELCREKSMLTVTSMVTGTDKTGLEMEALTAVSVCLLSVYDMCKALSKDMVITDIMLVSKSGGKTDYVRKPERSRVEKEGRVLSINISSKKGEKKSPVKEAWVTDAGIKGDGHSGNWHRQVSMLSAESIRKMNEKKVVASPGDFGENLTVKGLDLSRIGIGDILQIGKAPSVKLRVTQIGKQCEAPCSIYYDVGYCIMPAEGIFMEVVEGGRIRTDDVIRWV